MQQLKTWYYGLQPRERWMVSVASLLVVLTLIYLFVLAPFYAAIDARAERVSKKEADLAWMRSVASDVIALSQDAPMAAGPSGESLVVLVDRAARECGLSSALTGQTPNGTSSSCGAAWRSAISWPSTAKTGGFSRP